MIRPNSCVHVVTTPRTTNAQSELEVGWTSSSSYSLVLNLDQLSPGLIYRMIKPKVVLLIFVSGKTALYTGAKVIDFLDPPSPHMAVNNSKHGVVHSRLHLILTISPGVDS